jgi:putative sugar O-methyltransferase
MKRVMNKARREMRSWRLRPGDRATERVGHTARAVKVRIYGRSRWSKLTARSLAGIETCKPVYRPTNFWSMGLDPLLQDLEGGGLHRFKRWPSASVWFYPIYGRGFTNSTIKQTYEFAKTQNDRTTLPFMTNALNGALDAGRDYDAACLAWDQDRWPFDLVNFGESKVGEPREYYHASDLPDVGFGRPYLNYLLILAALSRHVETPPRSVLEIGGGFGVLGEILMSRDPQARYVDVDIPPLLTVASYYLTELFGADRVKIFDESVPDEGPIDVPQSGVLPNWRIEDISGEFDLFVNAFSFQEMEPDVVAHYIATVAAKNPEYVVSLNSKAGKRMAKKENEWGVMEQVTSAMISSKFEEHGYRVLARYGRPLIVSAGELVVMKRI